MSEQTEQASAETGSTGTAPIVPNSTISTPSDAAEPAPVKAEAATLVPDAAPEVSAAKQEPVKETAKETVKETAKPETPKAPGKLLIMSAADRDWHREEAAPQPQSTPEQGIFGKRRLAALAAVVALAAIAGALGGAMATVSLQHLAGSGAVMSSGNSGLETSVARIDADVVALKTGVEHTSKMGMSQFNKTSDRLDRLEKAQVESSTKLAKLGETIEKLHVTPPATPVAAAAPQPAPKDVTGAIAPSAAPAQTAAVGAVPKADAKPEVGRLPVVESWALQDVGHGGALIVGRQGIYEVYAGDVVPGLGRIDAVRRQDGRWVVVTSRGLIVAR